MKVKPKILLSMLLSLCMVLSLVPLAAFADTVELPSGVNSERSYNHTYHTKVETTANVSVKGANGNVIETMQVNKSGEFVEGNVSDTAVQAEIQKIDDEINAQFSSRGTLGVENRTTSLKFDHFDSNTFYSFIPASGDTVDFGTDTEAMKQYFVEHQDAVGTFNIFHDLHEYQVHQITYDLIVQENSQPAANGTITSAAVENVKLDYENGDAPKASARRAGVNMDKFDILYESWEKREKTDEFTTETVAYWYSDESWYQEGEERLTAFDKDGQYQYSVRLKARDGYTFSDSISADDITLNGKSLPEGSYVIVLDEGRSCIVIYGMTLRTVRPLESVTLNGVSTEFYVDGDKPRFNGYSGSAFSDVAYEKWEDKDDRSVGINSDESLNGGYSQLIESFKHGKTYAYGVAFNIADLGLEQGYRFDENTKLYLHGKEVTLNPQQVQVTDGGMTIRFTDVFSMTPEAPWQKIDVVEIEGAAIDFKAGDKPVFTGEVPASSPNVLRQCEFWEGSDGSGVNSHWFWDQNYEKHITAFESGKTYTYGVYVKAAHGYYFTKDTKLKINGTFYNYHLPEGDPELDNPDFMATLWAVTDLTVTPEGSGPHSHDYGTAWKYDEKNHWHECTCGDKVDIAAHTFKWVIDKEATATEKGSKHEECTVCGYKKTAVDIPAAGSETKPTDQSGQSGQTGKADQTGKSDNATSAETGDTSNMLPWIALLLISGGAVIGMAAAVRKKKYNR